MNKLIKPLLLTIALLFSTPAWAEIRAMRCSPDDANFPKLYKYETGFWGDKCYWRVQGRWEEIDVKATDWSCFWSPLHVIDFVLRTETRYVTVKLEGDMAYTETEKVDTCKNIELPD